MRYRRAIASGACWFFTVNLADRKQDLLIRHIDLLREVIRHVKQHHPFEIIAMVVMPDHLHAIWEGANKSYGTRAFTGNPLILND